MKRQILAAAAATALMTLFGCSSGNQSENAANTPQPPITATDSTMAPASPTPLSLVDAAPAPAPAPEVAMTATPSPAGGTSYTVQPGDTLYKIARDHYGDGKAWSKIASANPQITGTLIKPGEKLVIP